LRLSKFPYFEKLRHSFYQNIKSQPISHWLALIFMIYSLEIFFLSTTTVKIAIPMTVPKAGRGSGASPVLGEGPDLPTSSSRTVSFGFEEEELPGPACAIEFSSMISVELAEEESAEDALLDDASELDPPPPPPPPPEWPWLLLLELLGVEEAEDSELLELSEPDDEDDSELPGSGVELFFVLPTVRVIFLETEET
jgi:hypothetical protein